MNYRIEQNLSLYNISVSERQFRTKNRKKIKKFLIFLKTKKNAAFDVKINYSVLIMIMIQLRKSHNANKTL